MNGPSLKTNLLVDQGSSRPCHNLCQPRRWTKPIILSDEPRDFSEFPLVEIAAA